VSTNEESSFRLIASLSVAGLASGLLLVGAYLVTKPVIDGNRARAVEEAVLRVVPGASSVEAFLVEGEALVPYTGPKGVLPQGEAAFAAKDESGRIVGWGIPAEGPGFQDTVALIYGFDPGRRVIVGMEVLESRETPGLGDKIAKDPHFLSNFEALQVEPQIVAVKPNEKKEANQVDTISGATISSKAVVKILNESTKRWSPRMAKAPGAAAGEEAKR
jgi:electron transport complex protein RnfG